MTDFARRLVSGKKARTVDEELGTDLDLARISDQVIITAGIESLYRNRRKDVLRYLEHHYGRDWRIFNFVPRTENTYPSSDFFDQVVRTPFPDHHPPNLDLISLLVKEMKTYLSADKKRMAVIHCKAGKGRSGTMTCCYLLSLPKLPRPPQFLKPDAVRGEESPYASAADLASTTSAGTDESASTEPSEAEDEGEVAKRHERRQMSGGVAMDALSLKTVSHGRRRAEKLVAGLRGAGGQANGDEGPDEAAGPGPGDHVDLDEASGQELTSTRERLKKAVGLGTAADATPVEEGKTANAEMLDMADKLSSVFDLHSSTRMKPSSGAKGVSIPSQRRFVGYWARMLVDDDPRPKTAADAPRRKVVLTSITVRMSAARFALPGPLGGKRLTATVSTYRTDYVELIERRARLLRQSDGEPEAWNDDDWPDRTELISQVGRLVQSLRDDGDDELVRELLPAEADEADGLVIDADREVQIKMLVGKTGTKHGMLPDVTSLGYVWIVPSFESKPEARTHTFVARPDAHDVDFSKPQGRIEQIDISWRWL